MGGPRGITGGANDGWQPIEASVHHNARTWLIVTDMMFAPSRNTPAVSSAQMLSEPAMAGPGRSNVLRSCVAQERLEDAAPRGALN